MMDGRHLEEALAAGCFEIQYLNDVGQGFDNVHDTHQHQNQRHSVGISHGADGTAQEQRTGITHKDLGRVLVKQEEGEQTAAQCQREDGGAVVCLQEQYGKEHRNHQRNRGAQAVDAIGDVDGVVLTDDDENAVENLFKALGF